MSDVVKSLAVALPHIANVGKDGKSHHGAYSTLPALLDHVKPILALHGLAVMQSVTEGGVRTMFLHTSGDIFDAGTYPIGQMQNPQAQGSAVTYARRYALMAACGVSGSDDDAVLAVKATKPAGPRMISASQMKALQSSWSGVEREARLKQWETILGRYVASAKELTVDEFKRLMEGRDASD